MDRPTDLDGSKPRAPVRNMVPLFVMPRIRGYSVDPGNSIVEPQLVRIWQLRSRSYSGRE